MRIGWRQVMKDRWDLGMHHGGRSSSAGMQNTWISQGNCEFTAEVMASSQSNVLLSVLLFQPSLSLGKVPCNLRKCVWKEKLFWIRYSDRSELWDSEEKKEKLSWFHEISCISRTSGSLEKNLCPIEEF